MSELLWNDHLFLAQSIAELLAESQTLTTKEISRLLSQRNKGKLAAGAIPRAIHFGADFHGFKRLPGNRWTISDVRES